MATLKLARKTAAAPSDPRKPRPPVRGAAAPRKRPTLAQAQAERAARTQADEAPARPPRDRPARPLDAQPDTRPTTRPKARADARPDAPRSGTRSEARSDGRRDAPAQARSGARTDKRTETRTDNRADTRPAPRSDARRDTRPPAGSGTRPAARAETRSGAQSDRPHPRPHDTRPQARADTRGGEAPPVRARPRPDAPPARSRPRPEAPPPRAVPARPASPRPQGARSAPAGDEAPARRRSPAAAARNDAEGEGERLSKRMAAQGLASRREADEWIEAGWVRVDGRMAVLGQRVHADARIDIDPRARGQQAQRVTILLNKPVGYVSGQAEDGYENAATLIRPETQWSGDRSGTKFQRSHLRGLAPAGRLDIDSVGLLVLTQDGRVAKQLVGDESRVEKEYLVRVQNLQPGPLAEVDLSLLQHGLELDGQPLRPAKVSWQNEDQLRFVLREGKKRQIRRMCEAVGLKVLGLKRVRIGSVALGPLPPGQWRYLQAHERFA
jgi:23S rRNA pseudouridine2604 synthase